MFSCLLPVNAHCQLCLGALAFLVHVRCEPLRLGLSRVFPATSCRPVESIEFANIQFARQLSSRRLQRQQFPSSSVCKQFSFATSVLRRCSCFVHFVFAHFVFAHFVFAHFGLCAFCLCFVCLCACCSSVSSAMRRSWLCAHAIAFLVACYAFPVSCFVFPVPCFGFTFPVLHYQFHIFSFAFRFRMFVFFCDVRAVSHSQPQPVAASRSQPQCSSRSQPQPQPGKAVARGLAAASRTTSRSQLQPAAMQQPQSAAAATRESSGKRSSRSSRNQLQRTCRSKPHKRRRRQGGDCQATLVACCQLPQATARRG